MVPHGLIRPVFFMIVGWYLGTRRLLQNHSDGIQPGIVLLHPAYTFFYTMFAGAVVVLLYQELDRLKGNNTCTGYFYVTRDQFGFLTDSVKANQFLIRTVAVYAAQTLTAYAYAWVHRPKTGKIKDSKDMRAFVARYALYSMIAGLAAFGAVAVAEIWMSGGGPGAVETAPPCS